MLVEERMGRMDMAGTLYHSMVECLLYKDPSGVALMVFIDEGRIHNDPSLSPLHKDALYDEVITWKEEWGEYSGISPVVQTGTIQVLLQAFKEAWKHLPKEKDYSSAIELWQRELEEELF